MFLFAILYVQIRIKKVPVNLKWWLWFRFKCHFLILATIQRFHEIGERTTAESWNPELLSAWHRLHHSWCIHSQWRPRKLICLRSSGPALPCEIPHGNGPHDDLQHFNNSITTIVKLFPSSYRGSMEHASWRYFSIPCLIALWYFIV